MHLPDIGRVLPVYVADDYEGFDAKPFEQLTDAELDHYIEANVEAVRALPTPDLALANHLVMGPVVLARALGARVPYAVKIHGSALEYTVRPHPERFLPYALEGIRGANGVLVGSNHTGESLFEVLADEPSLRERTRLGPPGVDVHTFRRREPNLERIAARPAAGWGGEQGTADVLRTLDLSRDRIVSFVGKLIVSKGRGPAVRGLAAGGGPRSRRAAARDRLRHLPRRARGLRGRAAPRGRRGTEGDRRSRERARGRPLRRAQVPERLPRAPPTRRGCAPRPPRPSGSTSRVGSSTTTCPTCCPPLRRR